MKNKVLLIRPENVYSYNNYPPLNLICIGSVLSEGGYDVKIINNFIEEDSLKSIKKELEGTLFVGVTLATSEIPDGYRIIKFIRENSNVPIVVGGWHCTLFPEQMAESELVDYVVSGEGEKHVLDIANALKRGELPTNKIFHKAIVDLNTLPLPKYNIDEHIETFINDYLTDPLSEVAKHPMRWLPYGSSRGCPSKCTFCINVVTDNSRYRKKSAEKVANEIEQIVKRYKITHLKIIDDNFFVDIKRVRKICNILIEKNVGITWDAECRCDYFNDRILNDETLKMVKKAGLIQLTLGIESGSPRTLQLMKKGITLAQAEHAVKKCNEYGIIARSSFILEIPGEAVEDIKQTIKFINKLKKYPYFSWGVNTFRPYPKCELTTNLLKKGYLKEPKSFEEWIDKEIIDLYTAAEYIRPWQADSHFSESAAYYLNMESARGLGTHQFDNKSEKLKNELFKYIAKLRNQFMFYRFTVDKSLYKKFFTRYYKKRQKTGKT